MATENQTIAMACGAIAYTPPPLRVVRGVSMSFEQLDAFVIRILSPVAAERDEVRRLLDQSLAVMKALHVSAEPDESAEGVPCVIPSEPFRAFVDAHAELLYRIQRLGHVPGQYAGTFDMGITAAVQWVQARLDAFVLEHGCTDPDTGAVEFGSGQPSQSKDEYVGELMEIIDGLTKLATQEVAHAR